MHDAEDRSAAMYISNVGEMDDMIAEGNATQMILAHEALMEKRDRRHCRGDRTRGRTSAS